MASAPADFPNYPLAELHAHLSTSISPDILWQISHEQGIKLPKKEFAAFERYITLSPTRRLQLNEYFEKIYHPLLSRLSSGMRAVEQATYHTMVGAYRANRIERMELRTNPMKHNKGGEIDLDPLIMAMLRGMERALLECPDLSAGLIFSMAREFTVEQNAIILKKALKYQRRGVVGLDVSGPGVATFSFKAHAALFRKAHRAGLPVTVHTGEVADADDMWEALTHARPMRIGHGVRAAYDTSLMKELARRRVVLEVCPLSNLATKAVENEAEMKFILRTLLEHKVRFCINTDWPEIIEGCRLRRQYAWLRDTGILTEEELKACTRTAFEASFIPKPGGLDAYL